jgi:DNA-binding response OmpR family regulator
MNGFEFLEIIKADDTLRRIPVMILTASTKEQDVAKVLDMGVAGYLIKPASYTETMKVVRFLDMYWKLNRLPNEKIQILTDQPAANTSVS